MRSLFQFFAVFVRGCLPAKGGPAEARIVWVFTEGVSGAGAVGSESFGAEFRMAVIETGGEDMRRASVLSQFVRRCELQQMPGMGSGIRGHSTVDFDEAGVLRFVQADGSEEAEGGRLVPKNDSVEAGLCETIFQILYIGCVFPPLAPVAAGTLFEDRIVCDEKIAAVVRGTEHGLRPADKIGIGHLGNPAGMTEKPAPADAGGHGHGSQEMTPWACGIEETADVRALRLQFVPQRGGLFVGGISQELGFVVAQQHDDPAAVVRRFQAQSAPQVENIQAARLLIDGVADHDQQRTAGEPVAVRRDKFADGEKMDEIVEHAVSVAQGHHLLETGNIRDLRHTDIDAGRNNTGRLYCVGRLYYRLAVLPAGRHSAKVCSEIRYSAAASREAEP